MGFYGVEKKNGRVIALTGKVGSVRNLFVFSVINRYTPEEVQ